MSSADAPETPVDASGKKKRSPVERVIVWGLIILLIVAVGFEWRGQKGYSESLQKLEDSLDDARTTGNGVPLADAKGMVSMSPSISAPQDGDPPEVAVSWFTFFSFMPNRKYEIYLELDKKAEDAIVIGIATAAMKDLEAEMAGGEGGGGNVVLPATDDTEGGSGPPPGAGGDGPPPGAGGGGPPGGGPPGGNAGAGRPQRPGGSGAPGGAGGGGQPGGGGRNAMDLGIVGKLEQESIRTDLGLNEDQAKQIDDLVQNAKQQVSDLRSAGMRAAEIPAVMQGFKTEWTGKLKEILSEEQMQKLESASTDSDEG